MLCYVMLCYVMLCYVMLCYVMLCYVMLCYVMLCYVSIILFSIILYSTVNVIMKQLGAAYGLARYPIKAKYVLSAYGRFYLALRDKQTAFHLGNRSGMFIWRIFSSPSYDLSK